MPIVVKVRLKKGSGVDLRQLRLVEVTRLRGLEVSGGDFDRHRPSFFRFGPQHVEEQSWRCTQNFPVEPGFLYGSVRQRRVRGMARTIEEYITKEETIKLIEQL